MTAPLRIVQVGLGPIGRSTVSLLARKSWATVVGAIDTAPAYQERSLTEVCSLREDLPDNPRIYGTYAELAAHAQADAAVLATGSRAADALAAARPMLEDGLAVVSSCEELLFPAHRAPGLTAEADTLCRESGGRILGTGVNPGFVLDLLPLVLSGICADIQAVRGTRVVDAATRREPLQRKVGSGLEPDEYRQMWANGAAGHAGFQESLMLVAHALDWDVGPLTETLEPVIAEAPVHTAYFDVEPGQVRGLHQHVRAATAQGCVIELDLTMALGEPNPHDTLQLEANPPVNLRIDGGIAGDIATAAALVNALPALHAARPGVRLLTELVPITCKA